MSDSVEFWEKPVAKEMFMLAGWRQWADAGSISSGLPEYLVEQMKARKIGQIRPDGFYLFQFPGTHDLVRPVIRFYEGYPQSLQTQSNEFFFSGDEQHGLIIFLGDEPHMDVERYTAALLQAAGELNVKRIVSLGGVYGQLPYDRERTVSCVYSMPDLKKELEAYSVTLSNYQGGSSIDSYICRRAGEQGMEFVAFYAFVPNYDFSNVPQIGNTIRIENDFMAWLGVMRRVNYMLKLQFNLADLEKKSQKLVEVIARKVEELDELAPQIGLAEDLRRLSDEFEEQTFNPLDEVWEEELRRLLDKFDSNEN
jgi:proteasome assembly chaperone (PAC2) family protein